VDETDQAAHVTHHVYDLAGRLTSVTLGYGATNPATTAYAYYADGRKQTETDPRGNTTTYLTTKRAGLPPSRTPRTT